jgi:threonine dehydrogenase-like Zn-dependent dehydrogenase
MELLGSGVIRTEQMTTHRFPYTQATDAFDLLYNRMNEAMGVLLDWEMGEG